EVELLDENSGSGNSNSYFSIIPGQSAPPPSACQAYLGVMLKTTENASKGALVTHVEPLSPAAESGFQTGDVILRIDDIEVHSPQDAIVYIRGKCKGDRVKIKLLRGNKKKNIAVVLSEKHIPQANVWDIPREIQDNPASGSERAYLGVTPAAEQLPSGARIMIQQNSAAEKMGLRDFDNITEMNGEAILSFNDLAKKVAEMKPNEEVEIVISRDGKVKKLSGVLGSRMSGGSGDLKYFFDDKGLDEGGFPIMDFEFDMDMSELQQQLEELLRSQDLQPNSADASKIRITDATEDQLIKLASCEESPSFELISIGLNDFQNEVILRLLPTKASPVRIELLDVNGEIIFVEERKMESEYTRSMEIQHQNTGQYFLRITQEENCLIRSIVKSTP
ncbi:MAG: PDZ domain-containing protein, partial [Flavobacteriales bacterium]